MAKPKEQEWPVVPIDKFWDGGNRHENVKSDCGGNWKVSDLQKAVEGQPVLDVPLYSLPLGQHSFNAQGGLITFARHMKHIQECDVDAYPIILDEWGSVIDGRHRIVKALIEGRATIKAVKVPPGTRPTELAP